MSLRSGEGCECQVLALPGSWCVIAGYSEVDGDITCMVECFD
jgi:hypothetical protein